MPDITAADLTTIQFEVGVVAKTTDKLTDDQRTVVHEVCGRLLAEHGRTGPHSFVETLGEDGVTTIIATGDEPTNG